MLNRLSGRCLRRVTLAVSAAGLLVFSPAPGRTAEHSVYKRPTSDPFFGAFQSRIAIEVPPFHGIEPRLSLSYSSSGANGLVGVGWTLTGMSAIERASQGRGTPRYDATDIYLLDGLELVPCAPGMVSPSCTTGGTHATKRESYQRITYNGSANTWTVWATNGVRTIFSPVHASAGGSVFRWGQSRVIDTHGNEVTYTWECSNGDCYPAGASYGNYRVSLYRENRPDLLSRSIGVELAWTRYRLRSIVVSLTGVGNIRGYKLSYATSADTGRSRLTSVQQFGRDLVHADGLISSGTSLPAQTFGYATDPAANTLVPLASQAPPPATGTENVWYVRACALVENNGSSLRKTQDTADYDCGASSSRAIGSGDGGMEVVTTGPDGERMFGLSNGDASQSYAEIDYGMFITSSSLIYIYENAVFRVIAGSYVAGDRLRVEVSGGAVQYKKNGAVLYTSPTPPVYPLRVDTSIGSYWSTIGVTQIFGNLVTVEGWCPNPATGDFNGDGRADLACAGKVALGTSNGFAAPMAWPSPCNGLVGDFDGDGKSDMLCRTDSWNGVIQVALSTGSGFAAPATWSDGQCRFDANLQIADLNGDGNDDLFCKEFDSGTIWVGMSTSQGFSMSNWGNIGCADYWDEQVEFADMNSDGLSDMICTGNGHVNIYPSLGNGFWPAGSSVACGNTHALGDVNGDGRTDLYCSSGEVYLSYGNGWQLRGSYGSFCYWPAFPAIADLDGDGAGEVVCTQGPDVRARRWDGISLTPPTTLATGWCPNGVKMRFGDYTGDGKTDAFCPLRGAPLAHFGTAGVPSDLMVSLANGLGATTTVEYTPSTSWVHTNNPPVVQTVKTVADNDGRGTTSTTRYVYGGGLVDRREKRFLGFRSATVTLPCLAGETSCPYKDILFKQDYGSLSKVELEEYRRGDGVILDWRSYTYTTNGSIVPYTSLLTGEGHIVTDGSGTTCTSWPCASAKRTYVGHLYDAYGNETATQYFGDLDAAGDERAIDYFHFPNTSAYVLDRVAARNIHAGPGTDAPLIAQRLTHYDGNAQWNQPPTKGSPTRVFNRVTSSGPYVMRSFSYDSLGNLLTDTEESGRTTTAGYDDTGLFRTSLTNPASEHRLLTWDRACAAVAKIVDENGTETNYSYDPLCRRTHTAKPLGAFETRSFVAFGDASAQHELVESPSPVPNDPTGNLWIRRYFDGLGRIYRVVSKGAAPEDAARSDTSYDARGNFASFTAAYRPSRGEPPQLTTYSYDSLDRTVRIDFPDGTSQRTTYGLWSTTSHDEQDHPVTRHFDSEGRVISEQIPIGSTAATKTMSYDLLGNLTSLRDAGGSQWRWRFDALSRTTERSDPDSGTWRFEYDPASRQTAVVDARGGRTERGYDVAGRMVTTTAGVGTPAATTMTFKYGEPRPGHFNVGLLTTATDPASSLRIDYDALARPVRFARTLDGAEYVLEGRFDAGGRVIGMTYPDGDVIGDVAFDSAGRLRAIPGLLDEAVYDAAGRLTRLTNANGTVATRTFSPQRGRLQRLQATKAGSNILDLSFSHDPRGLLTAISSPNANESLLFSYDQLRRLTSASEPAGPSQTFGYDVNGNLTSNSRVGQLVYPAAEATRPHAPERLDRNDGTVQTFSYDANGNLLSDGRRTLTWTSSSLPATVDGASFTYDAFGRRIKKTSAGTSSIYPFGDDYEVTNGVVTKYFKLPGVGLVAKRVGAQTFWLHGDHQGSVKAITDAAGTVVQRRRYWAYGARRADETEHPEARGYIGQSLDEETGLSYLQARYYDSELGLFASPDPMPPLSPGVGLNRYAYALGNPANYIDPSGLNATKLEPGGETVYVVGAAPPMTFTDPGLIAAVLSPKRGGGSSGGSTGAAKVQATKPPPTDARDPVETKKPEEEDPAKTQPTAPPHDRHADQKRALEVMDGGEKVTDVVLDVLESMKTVPGDLINALMPNIGLKLDLAQTIAQPNLENSWELTLSALEMPRIFGVENSVVSAAGRLNLGWSYLQIARWEAQAVNDHFYTPTARNIYTVFCNPRHRVAYCP